MAAGPSPAPGAAHPRSPILAPLGACAIGERAEAIYLQRHRATTALTETIVAAEVEDPELYESLSTLLGIAFKFM